MKIDKAAIKSEFQRHDRDTGSSEVQIAILTKEIEAASVDSELESFINEKIAERAEAKKNKDFAKADAIRDELLSKGIVLKDSREGTTWSLAE